jgi:hypothetical protein
VKGSNLMACFILWPYRHKGDLFQSFDIVPYNLFGIENISNSRVLVENLIMHSVIDFVRKVTYAY